MAEPARGMLLAGVGGQGVILASAIVADTMLRAGFDVKQSEVHGMAQRGGSVFSHLRFGERVASPLVPLGSAEVLAAFEWAEALRWLRYVRPGGAVVVDAKRIVPPGATRDHSTWQTAYPAIEPEVVRGRAADLRLIDATTVASDLGNARAANSVILGAASTYLGVDPLYWEQAISRYVPPRTVEVNLQAFRAGREARQATIDSEAPGARALSPVASRIDLNQAWCKDCGICPRVCPEYCLAMDRGGKLVVVNPEACTGCRLCEMLCPDFAITIDRPPWLAHAGGSEQ